MSRQSYAGSIQLPDTDVVFRNIKNAKRFAIDIGGSLTKIAYYSTVAYRRALYYTPGEDQHGTAHESSSVEEDRYESSEIERLHFVKFETKYIEQCLDFLRTNLVGSESVTGKIIKVTGGGAYKYADLIQEKLGLIVDKEDEMACLIKGCNFLLRNIPDEQFEFDRHEDPQYKFINSDPNIFPYLLVNIGSGVSIMKVESDSSYERIGGTSLGGGTFWGLGTLLTGARGFDQLLDLASSGDHRNVDLLVKDIYGGDYSALGLPGDIIASSFGKAMHHATPANKGFTEADIARSLLYTVSNDIGQIASLYAMLHKLDRVYFGGYFLRCHPASQHSISYAIRYWSKGAVQALFLRHEGYLGAVGAFLMGAEEEDSSAYSWGENYAGSSGLVARSTTAGSPASCWGAEGIFDLLEMDKCEQVLTYFPLLANPTEYVPDTVDLTQDKEAREYWLSCFLSSLSSFVERAVSSQARSPDATARAQMFRDKFTERLQHLRSHPFAYGNLTVRSLLDLREHCLDEFDFPDPYLDQKKKENEAALGLLSDRLHYLDSLGGGADASQQENDEVAVTLVRGLLAGNVFDWGAKEVVALMADGLSFEQATEKLQPRPWLIDDLPAWLERLRGPAHRCAYFFLDNSGCDVVLGALPFARFLLARGTKVVLCANSKPALNDVTVVELEGILERACEVCPLLQQHTSAGTLTIASTGHGSPCLDFSRLPRPLVEEARRNCDLVIIEGMGRALHTNLDVRLTCDVLKLAVIKNRWLANRLGGDMFSVMCKFEPASNGAPASGTSDGVGKTGRADQQKITASNTVAAFKTDRAASQKSSTPDAAGVGSKAGAVLHLAGGKSTSVASTTDNTSVTSEPDTKCQEGVQGLQSPGVKR